MFYVIFRDYGSMLKVGAIAEKACDVLMTCTRGYMSCACEQAGNMSGNDFGDIVGARGDTAATSGDVCKQCLSGLKWREGAIR